MPKHLLERSPYQADDVVDDGFGGLQLGGHSARIANAAHNALMDAVNEAAAASVTMSGVVPCNAWGDNTWSVLRRRGEPVEYDTFVEALQAATKGEAPND